jgi:hypothetical protein
MKMKKLLLIALTAVAVVACSKSEDSQEWIDSPEGMGIVSFGVSPLLVVEGTRAQQQIPDGVTIPAAEDLKLSIISLDESLDYDGGEWESVASFNQNYKKTYFKAGIYEATVSFGHPTEEGENCPYFVDAMSFNVKAREKVEVSLAPKLGNSIVKVEFSERFKHYFENGAAITITSGNGNKWEMDYATTPYIFVESGKDVIISGYAIKQKPSASVEAPKVGFDDVTKRMAACTMYTYTYDVSTAGSVTVAIEVTNEPKEEVVVGDAELNDDAIM